MNNIRPQVCMGMSMVVGSLILAGAGKEADIVKMKEARKILKKKAPVFSAFRDSIELVVVSRMTLADDPEKYFDDLVEVYNMLKKGRIMEDSYYILSAMIIVQLQLYVFRVKYKRKIAKENNLNYG